MTTPLLLKILESTDLIALENLLTSQPDINALRAMIFDEFLMVADYKNAQDWNKAVRLCECLAIIGWGEHTPLEALRGKFYNGSPMTCFADKMGKRHFVDAIWSKRKNGLTLAQGNTSYHQSPNQLSDKQTLLNDYPVNEIVQDLALNSQRNWIAKSPIWVNRNVSCCYENSKAVNDSLFNDLQPLLNSKMRPGIYGKCINYITLIVSLSYHNEYGVKENYIITDTDKKLSDKEAYQLLHTMYSAETIKENGYYLRNRFEFGRFNKDTGRTRLFRLGLKRRLANLITPPKNS